MKKKIFLYYMILILIGVSVTGFFISELFQKYYINEVEDKLKNEALLIQYSLSSELLDHKKLDFDLLAKNFAKILSDSLESAQHEAINTRITLIDYQGTVVGESETNYLVMENHLERKEIKEAINGNFGSDIRFSNTLKMDFLYIALPLKASDIIIRVSVPLVRINEMDRLIWMYTLLGIFAGLLLTTILALRFSSSVIRPVNQLIEVTKEIAMGNYSKRILVKSRDEFGLLSTTFNEMATKLEKTVSDLKDKSMKVDSIMNSMVNGLVAVDSNNKVILINAIACEMFGINKNSQALGANILEIIRNNQLNHYLRKTMESNQSLTNEIMIRGSEDRVFRIYTNPIKSMDHQENQFDDRVISGGIIFIEDITTIKKLEQMRTEFVSNVTHELKTPLTSIRGFVETLRSGAVEDSCVADKFLEIIDIEAERLYMLINDILKLSEIESKQSDTNIGTYDLEPIIHEIIRFLQGIADKNGVTLTSKVHGNIKIVANKDRIKEMLINLIENGIKYNIENGNVDIQAYCREGKIVIHIKDTGIGIGAEHLPRIFERFYRAEKGRSRSMGGTGLGLSIVKHIVNLYSGEIKVNSSLGKGTEFIIQLPTCIHGVSGE